MPQRAPTYVLTGGGLCFHLPVPADLRYRTGLWTNSSGPADINGELNDDLASMEEIFVTGSPGISIMCTLRTTASQKWVMYFRNSEIKTGVAVFAVVAVCSIGQTIVNGRIEPIALATSILAGLTAMLSARFFVASKFENYLKAKTSGKLASTTDPEVAAWDSFAEKWMNSKTQPLNEMLSVARADIADMAVKETENRVAKRIEAEIKELTSTHLILDKVIHRLSDELRETVTSAVAYQLTAKEDSLLMVSSWSFNDAGVVPLNNASFGLLNQAILTPTEVSSFTDEDRGPLSHIGFGGSEIVFAMPLVFSDRVLGLILVGAKGKPEPLGKLKRALRNSGSIIGAALYRALVAEEIIEAQRRDKLTGFLNRTALEETLAPLDKEAGVSMLLIEGNNFVRFNESLGRAVADELLKALATVVRSGVRNNEEQCLFRVAAAQIALLLEDVDPITLMRVAERIKGAVERKYGWPGDVSTWTVSIAVVEASLGIDGPRLLTAGEDTILYMRQQGLANRILATKELPKSFATRKTVGIAGSLESFDAAEVLNSVGLSGSTGVLKITRPSGPEFWAFIEDGGIIKARVGKLRGDSAVVELLSMFDDGDFKFSETSPEALVGTVDDVSKLGKSYAISGINGLLKRGAQAQNLISAARSLIPRNQLYAKVVDGANNYKHWEDLRSLDVPPTEDELKLMVQILRLANGTHKLSEIFAMLDDVPSPSLWHCAALLIQHDFMRLNSLKIYAMPGHV